MNGVAQFEDTVEGEEVLGAKPVGMELPWQEEVQSDGYTPREKKNKAVINLEEGVREVINKHKAAREEALRIFIRRPKKSQQDVMRSCKGNTIRV